MSQHRVFISYSSQDQAVTWRVLEALESANIPCWIAPRNVPPGINAFEAIPQCITECSVLVLILSAKSMYSDYVEREIRLALEHKKTIIPFRIDDVPLAGSVHFMLTSVQWLDAFVPPMEDHLSTLVRSVQSFLDAQEGVTSKQPFARTMQRAGKTGSLRGIFLTVVALLICATVGVFFWLRTPSDAALRQQVSDRITAVMAARNVALNCAQCKADEPHVNIIVSSGEVTVEGEMSIADQLLLRSVPLDIRGVHAVRYAVTEIVPHSIPTAASPATRANAVAIKPSSDNTASAAIPTTNKTAEQEPSAEQLRARAAAMNGQKSMNDHDYVAAENYFRLALELDANNAVARNGLTAARKSLGEN